MATHSSKAGKQSKSSDAERAIPVEAPEEVTLADAPAAEPPVAEAPALEASFVEIPSAEAAIETVAPEPVAAIVELASAPLAVVEKAVESTTEALSVSFDFDAAVWSKKSMELWAENASAFLDLAEQIARAQTFEQIVELQSRFANQRFEAFIRQSKELMAFAQSVAGLSAAPLCDVRRAA